MSQQLPGNSPSSGSPPTQEVSAYVPESRKAKKIRDLKSTIEAYDYLIKLAARNASYTSPDMKGAFDGFERYLKRQERVIEEAIATSEMKIEVWGQVAKDYPTLSSALNVLAATAVVIQDLKEQYGGVPAGNQVLPQAVTSSGRTKLTVSQKLLGLRLFQDEVNHDIQYPLQYRETRSVKDLIKSQKEALEISRVDYISNDKLLKRRKRGSRCLVDGLFLNEGYKKKEKMLEVWKEECEEEFKKLEKAKE